MPDLFGMDIAGMIADEIDKAGGVVPSTLRKMSPGTRDPSNPTSGTNPTYADHDCQAFMDTLASLRPETIVANASAVVNIIGASVEGGAIPETGDQVLIESLTFTVLQASRDPAAAVYVCQVE